MFHSAPPNAFRVSLASDKIAEVRFVAGTQMQPVKIPLPALHRDVRPWVTCDGWFVPKPLGFNEDTRQLSLQVTRPALEAGDVARRPARTESQGALTEPAQSASRMPRTKERPEPAWPAPGEPFPWRCNLCGHQNLATLEVLTLDSKCRQTRSLCSCASWMCVRRIVHLGLKELFG